MTKNVPHMGFDPFAKPHFVNRGRYLAQMMDYPRRVPDLPWSPDLFQQSRNAVKADAPYFVQGPVGKIPPGEKCDWAHCHNRHNNHVQWTRRGDFGHGWRISYFCSEAHKTLAVREATK